ncbi:MULTISPECIES: ABC transporter substrate-binding protein [Limibacillus]|jgi:NitT/TauT family transport system substrate-binding protein|uniref:Thiamine pyrimidine synthase n=1 Tax=Limibacillus halophilus TaxID=1579333 RepID=A0A839SRV9_9PROT|nr:ABC transporter substrate-binding protein [Limibacillus halophilus]MBB3063755.1 NitT/TauT family transport system substrate-binding protein [Limibacillus halophilus]
MKYVTKRVFYFAALAALWMAAVVPAAADSLTKIEFLTNYAFHGRHSPYFVGLEKGFYKEAGFDIRISPATGSGFVVAAVDAGQADYGMADAGPVVQAVAKGAKVKGFMVFMDTATSGLASLKPYETPESLKGAKIVASQTDSARVILPIIYAQHNLNPADVHWETADPSVYLSLLAGGQADLMTASIDGDVPSLQRTIGQTREVYFSSFANWGYDVFGYLLIAKADRLNEKPEEARRFAEATKRAVEYAIEHPEETAEIMVKHNAALKYETTLAQWRQSIKAINTDYVKQHGYGTATDDRLQRTIDLMAEAMKLETPPVVGDTFAPAIPAQ